MDIILYYVPNNDSDQVDKDQFYESLKLIIAKCSVLDSTSGSLQQKINDEP